MKNLPTQFVVWYSGMTEDKVLRAFEKWKSENNVPTENTECKWKHVDVGMFGCQDYVYQTTCGKEYDSNKTEKSNFCPNCGNKIV